MYRGYVGGRRGRAGCVGALQDVRMGVKEIGCELVGGRKSEGKKGCCIVLKRGK